MQKDENGRFYVYMLQCVDGSLYTGYTPDPAKRLAQHQVGKGARYTRGRLPVKMVFLESFEMKNDALKREAAIKKLTRSQKLELIFSEKNENQSLKK